MMRGRCGWTQWGRVSGRGGLCETEWGDDDEGTVRVDAAGGGFPGALQDGDSGGPGGGEAPRGTTSYCSALSFLARMLVLSRSVANWCKEPCELIGIVEL